MESGGRGDIGKDFKFPSSETVEDETVAQKTSETAVEVNPELEKLKAELQEAEVAAEKAFGDVLKASDDLHQAGEVFFASSGMSAGDFDNMIKGKVDGMTDNEVLLTKEFDEKWSKAFDQISEEAKAELIREFLLEAKLSLIPGRDKILKKLRDVVKSKGFEIVIKAGRKLDRAVEISGQLHDVSHYFKIILEGGK